LLEIQGRFPDDIISAPGIYRQPIPRVGEAEAVGTFIDEWGCTFENLQPGVIGEVKKPLLESLEDLDSLRLPQELLSLDIEQVNAFCNATDLFVLGGCCPRPFERMQFIRGSNNLYIDLAEQSEALYSLAHRVHRFFLEELELWAKTDVDALTFMDDWGSQRALLISPALWRRFYKPFYRDYIELAHHYGKYAFMHSDGYIADIIPDLIELGLDALNSQLFCMDIEDLGRQFRGRLTFWGEIDRQYLLSNAAPAEVARAVYRVKEALYQEGGVIAQCEFGAGARPENVYQVFQSWDELM
jgi:hypothetical protein